MSQVPKTLYAVIDTETTGGTPRFSKLTDISIFITDGEQVLDEFSSLINPGIPIPPFITQLTGIDDGMVAGAPRFEEIAKQIVEITENTVFVAHNVNFDYGMLQHEFAQLSYPYERKKLCTVRLARKFLPGHHSYGLGNICSDLGIPIVGRHRARGDAEATVELFHLIYEQSDGHPTMENEKWLKSLPAHMDRDIVDRLPEEPGLYYLYDEAGTPLYVGASRNLFKAVTKQLTSKAQKNKQIMSLIHDIDFELTGSELIAQLRLQEERERLEPHFNYVKSRSKWSIATHPDLFGYLNLAVMPGEGSGQTFGSKKEALAFLEKITQNYHLCKPLVGLGSACQGACLGACRQLEKSGTYNDRVEAALSSRNFERDSFVILDHRLSVNHDQPFVLVENDQYIGYGLIDTSEESVGDFYSLKDRVNIDENTSDKISIIQTYLSKNKPKVIYA
ncbi:exonuclease domain-containing protein [Marinoscillum sp.]|uniref:exonuclease domain-containing protein n=1 Tax=Marinoscillum sp. TaxID=2024838 RepID=UPI003BA8D25E